MQQLPCSASLVVAFHVRSSVHAFVASTAREKVALYAHIRTTRDSRSVVPQILRASRHRLLLLVHASQMLHCSAASTDPFTTILHFRGCRAPSFDEAGTARRPLDTRTLGGAAMAVASLAKVSHQHDTVA